MGEGESPRGAQKQKRRKQKLLIEAAEETASSCCCSRSRKSSKIKSSRGNVKTNAEARQERAPSFCEKGSAPLALSPSPQGQNRKPGSKRKGEITGELQAGKTLKQL